MKVLNLGYPSVLEFFIFDISKRYYLCYCCNMLFITVTCCSLSLLYDEKKNVYYRCFASVAVGVPIKLELALGVLYT